MSRTKLHNELAKYKKGITEYDETSVSAKMHWKRYNRETGEGRNRRNILIEKIIDNENKT